MIIKVLSSLLAITSVSALGKLWQFDNPKNNEKTMKTILQSCYGKGNFSTEIFIYGDFHEIITDLPIIRVNDFSTLRYYREHNLFTHPLSFVKANVVVFIGDSPAEWQSFLILMRRTNFWDHMAQFFILGKRHERCENAANFLWTAWRFDILNAVYICSESSRSSTLYTWNPISDYAPHPWKRMKRADDLYVFRQIFDPDISCQHLNYDKTKFLNGYQIKAVLEDNYPQGMPWEEYLEQLSGSRAVQYKAFRSIVEALNAFWSLEIVKTREAAFDHFREYASDLMLNTFTLPSNPELSYLFPHVRGKMVAVVKLNPEVSTVKKILHLWSPPVLVMAAIAIAILFLILTIKYHSPSLAMLDVTRLLVYSTIHMNDRSHSFRIYFTTMLIFMVISDGVFEGSIAAFLTTREHVPALETINELVQLKYQMYTLYGTKSFAEKRCPKCNFIETSFDECVQFVLNGTFRTCAVAQEVWDENLSLKDLDYVKEPLNEEFEGFKCRRNWPLYYRFNDMVMRLVESGIVNHWIEQPGYAPLVKRKALEAEWSSPEYRDVKLVKLDFAFQLLAIGLSLATIVFVLELIVSKFSTFLRSR